eukprot:TRINITY_DN10690_c0_g1_i1.p2 TRINITY_DN10690_c0_g1~~TRINITY_DN10690_c0_g1_i1.p2  ORF type:complete len:56 (+),score=1.49 TRINITY_DN10690_c0_g1_i1:112-279(+)
MKKVCGIGIAPTEISFVCILVEKIVFSPKNLINLFSDDCSLMSSGIFQIIRLLCI